MVKFPISIGETAYCCATIKPMRFIARVAFLSGILAMGTTAIARAPFQVQEGPIDSIENVIEPVRGPLDGGTANPDQHLPAYADEAQCGGWDQSTTVEGYISTVTGLPGREHDWDGAILSGIGTREPSTDETEDDTYTYPDSAIGFATTCEASKRTIIKRVWRPGPNDSIVLRAIEFAHPYFEDPVCRWRYEENGTPPQPLQDNVQPPNSDQESWEFEERASCTNFCTYVNRFVYRDCLEPVRNPLTGAYACAREGNRYICSDEEVKGNAASVCTLPQPPQGPAPAPPDEEANARWCVGEQCRCPNDIDPDSCPVAKATIEDRREVEHPYRSYYRAYLQAGYSRKKLEAHVPDDVAAKTLQTTCFGLYNEFDPLTHRTIADDRRCVINVDVENMVMSQVGKATHVEQNVEDVDPTNEAMQRRGGENDQPGEFSAETDTWYQKLGGAFSLVNETLFDERYEKNLSNVYLAFDELDDGTLKATPQLSASRPLAEGNLQRSFDDTGMPRAFSRWWQDQQTRMASLLHPPVLRFVAPSAWFIGLDADDPFLQQEEVDDASPSDLVDRSDRIELQISADEDILGSAMAYIERAMLLHVEEEPISVVIPMGSPTEFRARAADWCTWYLSEHPFDEQGNPTKDCSAAPTEVTDIIERLEEYATIIDDYRLLRAETAKIAGKVLELQRDVLEPVATWFKENEAMLQHIVEARTDENGLAGKWNDIDTKMAELHDTLNMPWCMNQRYTAPIYSLLDPWLKSRARTIVNGQTTEGEVSEYRLPELPVVTPEDVIVDFSAFATLSGTIMIPVLKPVQIQIDVPTPPTTAELAELPAVKDLIAAVDKAMVKFPRVQTGNASLPQITLPSAIDAATITEAQTALSEIMELSTELNERYRKFWESIGPLQPEEGEPSEAEKKKLEMKCTGFNDMPCEHVEMDLLERVQRIGSRPLVQLEEDFDSVGTARMEASVCLPEDDACHLLHAERTDPEYTLEMRSEQKSTAAIDALRTEILKFTLPPPLGTIDPLLLAPHEKDVSPARTFPVIRILP